LGVSSFRPCKRHSNCAAQKDFAEIEAEQALVAANRDLIARFEKKIQTTLARIWGEELGAAAATTGKP
jgi:hypothetical protein